MRSIHMSYNSSGGNGVEIWLSAILKLGKMLSSENPPTTELKVETKRKLTAGEIKMSRLIFQDSIDYSKIWIHVAGYLHRKTGNAMTPAGEIYLPKEDYLNNKDFSVSPPHLKHWFMHEMTHVWQYQLGASVGWLGLKQLCKGGYTKSVNSADSGASELLAYDTDILNRDQNKKFSDLNFEQQGRVVEFYFDGMYLKEERPERAHHQKSLKMLLEVQAIIMDLIIDPTDKMLLPKA